MKDPSDLTELKREWQSDVWRDLGISAEEEAAMREQFRKRIQKKTKGWLPAQLKELGAPAALVNNLAIVNDYLESLSLAGLIGMLLRAGINVNILIPTDSVPATHGKLRLLVKTEAQASVGGNDTTDEHYQSQQSAPDSRVVVGFPVDAAERLKLEQEVRAPLPPLPADHVERTCATCAMRIEIQSYAAKLNVPAYCPRCVKVAIKERGVTVVNAAMLKTTDPAHITLGIAPRRRST